MRFLGKTIGHPLPGLASIPTPPYRELPVYAHAILITLFQSNIDGTRIGRMHGNWEAKTTGEPAFSDIDPLFTTIVATIDTAVILLIDHIRVRGMHHHLMDTLPKFRELGCHKVRPHILVIRGPGRAAIISAVTACRR